MSHDTLKTDNSLLNHAFIQEWTQWQAEREAALQAPYGWLSLTGIHWITPSGQTQLADIPGFWTENNGAVYYHPAPDQSAPTDQDGTPVTSVLQHLSYESATPTLLYFGEVQVELINRDGRFALRTRDPHATSRTQFSGVESYPAQPEWNVPATFNRLSTPTVTGVKTIVPGVVQQKRVIGTITFTLSGTQHQLDVLETNGAGPSILFRDLTSGSSTYGAGRFIYLFTNDLDSLTSIDFNRAINPPCYFSAYCTCPVALSSLNIAVTAGEKVSTPAH